MIAIGLETGIAMAPEVEALGTLDEVVLANLDLWPVLLLVPLAIAGYAWAARRRRAAMRSLGNPTLVSRLVGSVDHGNRVIQAVAATLALAAIGVGLLRLQYGGQAKVVPASGLDVVIAVDYSKSMLAQDVYPSRSERLEAELMRFLDDAQRRGDRMGLVIFAGQARGLPVTRDSRLLKLYLSHADPRTENPGGTAIGRALALGLTFLVDARSESSDDDQAPPGKADPAALEVPETEADQAIILLTDGEDTVSRPLEVAQEAARLGVRIYPVGIGSRSGEPIQRFDAEGQPDGFATDDEGNYIMTRLDEALLQELATSTGGRYVQVDPERFGLDEVRDMLEDLSRSKREDTVEIHREEGFTIPVAIALLLLSLALGLGDRRRAA